jgi:hypothetical protein
MGFLNLTVYNHSSGLAFDPDKVIERVKESFPEAELIPGDQSQAEVQRAEAFLADKLQSEPLGGPASKIVASLKRKADVNGPSYAFRLPIHPGPAIDGLARIVGVQFLFPEPLLPEVRDRLVQFLTSLGVGRLEEAEPGTMDVKVVADFPGPCSWSRNAPGAAWKAAVIGPNGWTAETP